MRPMGVNYRRLVSAWEPRFFVERRPFIAAGLWVHGVPNHQPFQAFANGTEWPPLVASKHLVTEG
jgi:hypothetical protein